MKLAVLGAGPGGYVAAIKAAQLGAQVTVIEEEEVGGTCLNWGCIPTKSLIASSEILTKTRHLEDFGIDIKGEIIPNFSKIIERKNKIVNTQVKAIKNLFKSWGITLKEGRGSLSSPDDITVVSRNGSKEKINAYRIIIATGSRPALLPEFPFDGDRIISSDDAVHLRNIPKSLVILGAGAVGCEFAFIYRAFGSEITIIELLPRAVPEEDIDISRILEKELKKKKIKLYTGVKVEKMSIKNDCVHTLLSNGEEIVAEKVLVSVGRTFNSNDIGLEEAGIETGDKGEIVVNDKMETNIPGVYAVGDVKGGLLLAHVASREGIIAAKNAVDGNESIDYNVVPSTIFTSPEIASVGLKEYQAQEKGISVKTGHFEFRALGKAHAIGEIEGLIKIVSESKTDRILGVHIIGPHASDLIHEAAIAIKAGLKTRDISETIHAHPTLSEGFKEAAGDVHNEAIHKFRRRL
ncbi:MAG: dihydrolipoyl dehydrogenase [Nitrospirae bacterium]|jgi:dihydrolipoamide dehydrogenase|nr:dihydrolipoyl dehydrogenase [Nitrospirota bacterium]